MKAHVPARLPRPPPKADSQDDKENLSAGPPEKKRKLAAVALDPPPRGGLPRESLSTRSNMRRDSAAKLSLATGTVIETSALGPRKPAVEPTPEVQWEGLSSANMDVEGLLNTRMGLGKTKFDYKGRAEQMTEYIKKLRTCIRGFQQLEHGWLMEKENMQQEVKQEAALRETTVAELQRRQGELAAEVAALKETLRDSQESLKESQTKTDDLLKAAQIDATHLREAALDKERLQEELVKVKAELSSSQEQLAQLRDINTRLQEYNTSLQQYNSKLQGDAAAAQALTGKVQAEKAVLVEEAGELRGTNAALQASLSAAKDAADEALRGRIVANEEADRVRAELAKAVEEREAKAEECRALLAENARYRECTGKSAADLDSLSSKAQALEEGFTSQAEIIAGLRRQLEVANQKLQLSESLAEQRRLDLDAKRRECDDVANELCDLEERFLQGEELRRKLHNTIQELKGNIRVFCRVRPALPEDDSVRAANEPVPVQYPTSAELSGRGIELVPPLGSKYTFAFDKVFGPEVPQGDVFIEISQLVQSALDGYKVCIFAYGQTGSGKTHTMLGAPLVQEQRGMIPRSLEQIFHSSQRLASQGWKFSMEASMLEIYNETLRDLLAPPASAPSTPKGGFASGSDGGGKQHIIKHDAQGNTTVSDLTLVQVASWDEVEVLLTKAAQSRSVGRTAMNERSSRSHCVFTLRIAGTNESSEQSVNGVLNLIDLAGSERLSRSGATGDRLKETQAINKSLSSLGDVISAIGNREAHIPYRNSKLTYLLQPCLGGDSKTLMFVNIAPDRSSFNESRCSLRFAAKVNACEIGVPRRNAKIDAKA